MGVFVVMLPLSPISCYADDFLVLNQMDLMRLVRGMFLTNTASLQVNWLVSKSNIFWAQVHNWLGETILDTKAFTDKYLELHAMLEFDRIDCF
jgi:hypothetical protein